MVSLAQESGFELAPLLVFLLVAVFIVFVVGFIVFVWVLLLIRMFHRRRGTVGVRGHHGRRDHFDNDNDWFGDGGSGDGGGDGGGNGGGGD